MCTGYSDDFNISLISLFPQSLVSGGVDSAVCTALLSKALGPERVMSVHIDNGFMRKGERQQVMESLKKLGIDVQGVC